MRSITARLLSSCVFLLVMVNAGHCDTTAAPPAWDYWMGVYYKGTKIGCEHTVVRSYEVEGKRYFIKEQDLQLRFKAGDRNVRDTASYRLLADEVYVPFKGSLNVESIDSNKPEPYKFDMTMHLSDTEVSVSGSTMQPYTYRLTDWYKGCVTELGRYEFGITKLSTGNISFIPLRYFRYLVAPDSNGNYVDYSWDGINATVLRTEKLDLEGVSYDTFVVSETSKGKQILRWLLANGEIIKEEMVGSSVTLVREPEKKAREIESGDIPDLSPAANSASATQTEPLKTRLHLPLEYWMGIYYRGVKIGYSHVTIKQDKLDGKDVYKREEVMRLRVKLDDGKNEADLISTSTADTLFKPISDICKVDCLSPKEPCKSSGGVSIKHNGQTLDIAFIKDGKSESRTLPRDDEDREFDAAGTQYDFGARELAVGDNFKTNNYHPLWVSFDDANLNAGMKGGTSTITVLRSDKLDLGGETFNTLVVSEQSKAGEMLRWHLDNGEVVKQEIPASSVVWIREPKEKATEVESGEAPDISKLVK